MVITVSRYAVGLAEFREDVTGYPAVVTIAAWLAGKETCVKMVNHV